jgi:DNA modification methylase
MYIPNYHQKFQDNFLEIKISNFDSGLPQNILDIQDKIRSNIFNWRGQFSPQLIENLILYYCPRNATIFDPFTGSGTVLYEGARFGLPVVGCELNPAAFILSKTYEFINLTIKQRQEIISAVKDKLISYFPEPQLFDLSENKEINIAEFSPIIFSLLTAINSWEKIIIEALVILLDLYNKSLTKSYLYGTFFKLTETLNNLPYSSAKVTTILSDARAINIDDNSIDFVITSPPYINVFNYHQNYRYSAEILGWNLLKIAKSEIGSNRANRGNRLFTVVQYCLDLAYTLKEIQRVCNSDSRIIFVVGYQSNVLGVPFYNADIISEIAVKSGVFDLVLRQKRTFKNKFGKNIREDLLHLVNKNVSLNITQWEELARNIATTILHQGLTNVNEKNRSFLITAIEKINLIEKSPLCNY